MEYSLAQMFKAVLRSVLDVRGRQGTETQSVPAARKVTGETHSKSTVFNIFTSGLNKPNKEQCAHTRYFDLNHGTDLSYLLYHVYLFIYISAVKLIHHDSLHPK